MMQKLSIGVLSMVLLGAGGQAEENPTAPPSPASASSSLSATAAAAPDKNLDTLKKLREQIAKQEEAIRHLQESLEEQRSALDTAIRNAAVAPAASAVKLASSSSQPPLEVIPAVARGQQGGAVQKAETAPVPAVGITIGNTTFSPLGFVDATFYSRSSNVGSGIGTNFGGIPYNNTATDHVSESNFSTQNSRLGFRVDSTVLGSRVLGYFEADFLGNAASSVYVTSNAMTFRMRNVFLDVQKHRFEFLAGQDWSLATPNRVGLSPLPADIFYTQDMDTNYQAGLVWTRQGQFRFVVHPTDNFAFGVSLENPQQYIGGSGGLSATAVTLPAASALSGLAGTQLNNGSNTYSAANLHPDIIAKAAYDAHVGNGQILHFEAGGIVRSFKDAFATGTPVSYQNSTVTAVSGEVNANLEVVKGFRLIANTFFGSGNGRYVFGLAPDLIVRANGSLSPVHTYSTVDGFELTLKKNTVLYAYYGGVDIQRDVAVDANGKTLIGYGYSGSSNADNRTIQEITGGVIQTFWKNPNYGALALITQYSYLTRNPWYVALGLPDTTHTNMVWVDFRYTLP